MDRQRPQRAWSRAWLGMAAAALLAACQGLPPQLSFDEAPESAGPGWRVVERLGEARYLAPSMASWQAVAMGSMIPAGSQVTTGTGGRLIVQHAASQLSAGTSSRFILPGWEPEGSVRQTAGWLRYRITTPPPASFGIETPFLDLVVDDAVLDVTVRDSATEVAVVSGRVRVKSLDDRRQIDLHAGYTGYAGLQGGALAVRRGPGQRLEAVPPIVIPALHPDRPAGPADAPDPAGDGAPAAATPAAPTLVPRPALAVTSEGADEPAAADQATAPDAAASGTPTSHAAAAPEPAGPPVEALAQASPNPIEPEQTDQAEQVRQRFDAMTEGLLDGLLPALPEPQRAGR